MTGLHYAVSIGFGLVGVAVAYAGRRLWNAEADIRRKRRQIQNRIDGENEKRIIAIEDLEKRLDESLKNIVANGGLESLLKATRTVETTYYEWLSQQANLFYVVWEDVARITGTSNGSFKYELPENIRKFKRKKRK